MVGGGCGMGHFRHWYVSMHEPAPAVASSIMLNLSFNVLASDDSGEHCSAGGRWALRGQTVNGWYVGLNRRPAGWKTKAERKAGKDNVPQLSCACVGGKGCGGKMTERDGLRGS